MRESKACDMLRAMVVDQGWVLLDVRAAHEYHHGHLTSATHVPLPEVSTVDPDHRYLVYCNTGSRSATAADYLKMRGIEAINIGGINELKDCFGVS